MSSFGPFPRQLELSVAFAELIIAAAVEMAQHSRQASRICHRLRRGVTLRTGRETPLWNELRTQLRPHLVKYGD